MAKDLATTCVGGAGGGNVGDGFGVGGSEACHLLCRDWENRSGLHWFFKVLVPAAIVILVDNMI